MQSGFLGGFGVLYSKIFVVAQICWETTKRPKLGDGHDIINELWNFFLCFLIDKYWFYFSIRFAKFLDFPDFLIDSCWTNYNIFIKKIVNNYMERLLDRIRVDQNVFKLLQIWALVQKFLSLLKTFNLVANLSIVNLVSWSKVFKSERDFWSTVRTCS